MKILLSIASLFCFSLSSYSQNFLPGYFINNEGEKVECLIDNTEAIKNPESFQYKLSKGDQIKEITIRDVKAFEILDTPYKFERAIVSLDLSEDGPNNLGANREPNFKRDTLFLKVSLEGKASLYTYQSTKLPVRFFYSLDKTEIEPLIFKRYLVEGSKIRINNRYKQQLINNFKCLSLKPEQISHVRYTEKSLINIFIEYNICEEKGFVNYFEKRRKGEFNLVLKAGVNYSAINFIQKEPFPNEQQSDPYLSPRIGIEIEYRIPVLNNMFSIISYPSYQHSKTSNETLIYRSGEVPSNPGAWVGEKENLLVDFSRIILPVGIRTNYYQGQNFELYLQGAAVYNILTNPSGAYNLENFQSTFRFNDTSADPNIDISTGVKFRKWSLDLVYSFQNLMKNRGFDSEIQNSITLNLGYNIL